MKMMNVKLDTILANQDMMNQKLDAIRLEQIKFTKFKQGDIDKITRHYSSLVNNIKWLGDSSLAGYANQKRIYDRNILELSNKVQGMQTTEFSTEMVREYVLTVLYYKGVGGYQKAGELLEQLITVRFQLYAIQMAAA
jgi:hypothetical protein